MSNNVTPTGSGDADTTVPRPPVRTSAKQAKVGGATLTVEPVEVQGFGSNGGSSSVPAPPPPATQPMTSGAGAPTQAAPSGPAAAAARPAPKPVVAPQPNTGPRRVRLSISRIDPWSVMKLGFLLSVALGIATVVAAAVAWKALDSMGVFADLQGLIDELGAMEQFGVILEYLKLKNIMSLATIVAIVNVALITALTTLGTFIYNIVAALVGGLHMTLTDD